MVDAPLTKCRTCPALFEQVNGWLYCAECASNGRRQRDTALRRAYGVFGLLAYEAMLAAQRGRCANELCDRPPVTVDHDHDCCAGYRTTCGNCVRRLLCGGCNAAEGHLRTSRRAVGLALMLHRGRAS